MADPAEGSAGKHRKRQALRVASEQPAKKVKSTIHISREADIRLNIHCAMMAMDRSALVEKLINDHLRRYVVSDRGGGENASEEVA